VGLIVCLVNVAVLLSHVDTQQNGPSAANVIVPVHHDPNLRKDKEPILKILKEAGFDDIDDETISKLPTWTEVTNLYGDHPRIYGLDQCKVFQSLSDPAEHFVGVAGTFNSGTNLMSELLIHNCENPARMEKYGRENKGIRWQVPWGKHQPAGDENWRQSHKTQKDKNIDANDILPAVTIRDPYMWMNSMCRIHYKALWPHNPKRHCPNLIPNAQDKVQFPMLRNKDVVPVTVHYPDFVKHHDSLAHYWNDWYNEYFNAEFPRLMVRFEDLIFHAKEVTTNVCTCAGGKMKKGDFVYIVDSAKKGVGAHGKMEQRTSFIDAIVRYGKDTNRLVSYTVEDLKFSRKSLDRNMMEFFGYLDPK
jgi:hypothetical protein